MSQEHAWPLIEAGYNAAELSEALEVSGQTARSYIREYRLTREPKRASAKKGGSRWMDRFSLTQLWQFATQNHSGDSGNETTHA